MSSNKTLGCPGGIKQGIDPEYAQRTDRENVEAKLDCGEAVKCTNCKDRAEHKDNCRPVFI